MERQELFTKILENFDAVVHKSTEIGRQLRLKLEGLHPADIAYFFSLLVEDESRRLFLSFSLPEQLAIFKEFSDARKAAYLTYLDERQLRLILMHLSVDELTDFFDELSDEELQRYLRLLQKKDREQVVSVLQQAPDSAGRHMDVNVLALLSDFTVEKSIQLLQRLQPDQELHRMIFVTTKEGRLEGHILLEDLVLKKPATRLSSIVRENAFDVQVDEDREEVAHKMMKYNVMTAPVVDRKGSFLGVITSEELVDILEEESSEDIFRMATMSPIKDSYFETSFLKLFFQRSSILVVLLFAQSISAIIIASYEVILGSFLLRYLTMLTSTGGNTSSQTSALVIQGLATGEIDDQNLYRFIRREFFMSAVIGLVLGVMSFIRVYGWSHSNFWNACAVSSSLVAIVIISSTLGSCIPLILKKLNMDPAHSAGPLLATLMDIIGIFIYCVMSNAILGAS